MLGKIRIPNKANRAATTLERLIILKSQRTRIKITRRRDRKSAGIAETLTKKADITKKRKTRTVFLFFMCNDRKG